MGAGLVLDGKLYAGTNDNAGEVGHIRLSDFGPVGYGKAGSFEGFASGGGIAQLAASAVKEKLMMGEKVAWCPDGDLGAITAKTVAEAAAAGDELAIGVYKTSATYLGKALSILIDIVNPEVIAIGSIFVRAEELIRPFRQKGTGRHRQGSPSCRRCGLQSQARGTRRTDRGLRVPQHSSIVVVWKN